MNGEYRTLEPRLPKDFGVVIQSWREAILQLFLARDALLIVSL